MKQMEKKKEQKRKVILSAAQEIFLTKGYVTSNMDVIAQKAGVTKQTLYRYFTSKEVLFQASLESRRKDSQDRFLGELEREDAWDALLQFAIGFTKVHMAEAHLATIRLLVAEGARAPEMAGAHYAMGSKKVGARLTQFFTERLGMTEPEDVVEMFLAMLLARRMDVLIGVQKEPSLADVESLATRVVSMVKCLVLSR